MIYLLGANSSYDELQDWGRDPAWRSRPSNVYGTATAAARTFSRRFIAIARSSSLNSGWYSGVMTSASILQGRLSRGLPTEMQAALPGLASDAQRAIQFVRSAPGVTTALVGMAQAAHVEHNLGLLGVPPLPTASIAALFAEA